MVTPTVVEVWRELPRNYPDRAYCFYLLDGIREGFCIARGKRVQECGLRSALEHPEEVSRLPGWGGGFWQGVGAPCRSLMGRCQGTLTGLGLC